MSYLNKHRSTRYSPTSLTSLHTPNPLTYSLLSSLTSYHTSRSTSPTSRHTPTPSTPPPFIPPVCTPTQPDPLLQHRRYPPSPSPFPQLPMSSPPPANFQTSPAFLPPSVMGFLVHLLLLGLQNVQLINSSRLSSPQSDTRLFKVRTQCVRA